MTCRLGIIIASVREARVGDDVGVWVAQQAREHGFFDVDLIDLAEVALPPIAVEPDPPERGNYTDPSTIAWAGRVGACHAFVIVTPEYNHGYPASLKNALDRVFAEWAYKPVGFVSYGGVFGGVRAVEQLRQVVVPLRMIAVPDGVTAPYVSHQIDGGVLADPGQTVRMTRMLDELAKLTPLLTPLQPAVGDGGE